MSETSTPDGSWITEHRNHQEHLNHLYWSCCLNLWYLQQGKHQLHRSPLSFEVKIYCVVVKFQSARIKKFLWRQIRAMLLIYKVKSCRSASSTSRLPSFCLWTHLYLLLSSLSCSLSAFFWPALYCCCCFFFSILTDMLNKAIIMRPPTAGKLSNNSNINPTNSIQLPGPAWY